MTGSPRNNTLCIVPCFNEAANLDGLLRELSASGLPERCDLLFVNDGSQDRTSEILIAAPFPVIHHPRNLGYGAAVKTGIQRAREENYRFAAVFPGDRQRNPQDLLRLVEQMSEGGCDLVVGGKLHAVENMPRGRAWGNRFFSWWARFLWSSDYADVLSGFKVYRVESFAPWLDFLPDGYEFDIVCSLLCRKLRLASRESPVAVHYHEHSTKMRSVVGVGLNLFYASLRAWWGPAPKPLPATGD